MTIYGRKITDDDMETIGSYMNDDIREELHAKIAGCTAEEFISAYLERDPDFITLLENEFRFDEDGLSCEPYYEVCSPYENSDDVEVILTTSDLERAKDEARYWQGRKPVEIREIVHEVIGGYDYNTIDF